MTVDEIIRRCPDIDRGLDNMSANVRSSIIRDRFRRTQRAGFIITCNSKKRGTLYVQDPRISNKYIWTSYKSNALVFPEEWKAHMHLSEQGLKGEVCPL